MTLPAPNLDDRRFQQLVDDAKRMVQRQCPEWTDHNVHDPGVVLIETFAFMVDQLLYRLNRVPDRLHVKFLELLGVRLFPPTAARADVTFWLSAPREETLRIPASTEVATPRGSASDAVVSFTTVDDLDIVHSSLHRLASMTGDTYTDHTDEITGAGFLCFSDPPVPGDSLLVGLAEPAPSCAVQLRIGCPVGGVGVDPRDPPLVWEALCGDRWERCDHDGDTTGGLNRAGEVVVHLPRSHSAAIVGRQRAGWLRCRVTEPVEGQPFYSASPQILSLEVDTVGGTAGAVNAAVQRDEVLGTSEGIPDQRFSVLHRPVVPGEQPVVVETGSDDGWIEWTLVDHFGASGPQDRHVLLDATVGEISFGPAVRLEDGTVQYHGARPPKGALVRVPAYWTGGGAAGNVARGALSVLKTSIPFVTRVENRRAAEGGVDGETVEEAKIRGPVTLRTQGRAVTREDFEHLARQAAPEVARVHCLEVEAGAGSSAVRVLVVPAAADGLLGALSIEQLIPSPESLSRIATFLDERRTIGARVVVEPPTYMGVTAVARIRARPGVNPARLKDAAVEALNRYFHPISGGPEGSGWPFGRPVLAGEVFGVLQRLPGTELVEDARLFPADVMDGSRGEVTTRIDLEPNALVLSYNHQVRVESS
ncbi:MAG: putative baseplate assembly protein [Acidimicrobiales bacterium]